MISPIYAIYGHILFQICIKIDLSEERRFLRWEMEAEGWEKGARGREKGERGREKGDKGREKGERYPPFHPLTARDVIYIFPRLC